MEPTLEEVQKFLAAHADEDEVKAFIASIAPAHEITAEEVLAFVGTDDGRAVIQPSIDQAVTKAVKTRDKAHEVTMEAEVRKRVAAEVLKLNPQKEPWQVEIEELKRQNEEEKKLREKDIRKRAIVESAAKMGVNPFFVDVVDFPSVEEGELYTKKFKEMVAAEVEKAKNELLANGSFKPAVDPKKGPPKGKMSAKDYAKLPFEERIRMQESGEAANVVPDTD